VLSAIVRSHRRKLRRELFDRVRPEFREEVLRLALLFRLAVRLNRSRSGAALPDIRIEAAKDQIHLSFPEGWLEEHPLTGADLAEEVESFRAVGFALSYR
jgi:exopolyphosphatase/guanosine-5'-triphosphate,3'-diphosphate pyrophosphatase